MSHQHITQTSGQGMLERVFKLREHGTTARTEVTASFTTFLTTVYIVLVSPQTPGAADMDINAVFVITCLIAASGSIMMGLLANPPVALVPAMDPNAFFVFVVVQTMGLPRQVGMSTIFRGAIGLLLLMIFRVRRWMIANIPASLRVGTTSGISLFTDTMGLKNAGVIAANPETLVSISNLTSHSVFLGILGSFIIATLVSCNVHAVVLVSVVTTTLLGWVLGGVHYNGIASTPPGVMTVVGHVDLAGSFNLGLAGVIFSFMLVNLFDSSGMLIGVADKAGLVDEKGEFPRMRQTLYVDSISPVTGSSIGISSVTAYTEPSPDVSVGGRTGLMAVVVGLLFLLVIFLSPLAGMMLGYAVAGVLIYVGVPMTSSLAHVNWQDLTESAPVFTTAVVMPSSFLTAEGIVLGSISYCMMKVGTGRLRDLSPCVIIVVLLFISKIVFIGAH